MKKITLLCLILAMCAACGSTSPTAPTLAPLICASGQSNMNNLLPVLKSITRAQGWSEGAQPIRFWDTGSRGWDSTAPFLTPDCATFAWLQGETDDAGGETPELGQFGPTLPSIYQSSEANLFARVRARTSSTLPIVVIQIAPRFATIRPAQAAVCASDPHCRFLSTDDLAFPDGIHLDDASLRTLAMRIMVR